MIMRSSSHIMIVSLIVINLGCDSSKTSSSDSPPATAKTATDVAPQQNGAAGTDEAVAILKAINESLPKDGQVRPGTNIGVTQVGTHQLRTEMDVNVSSSLHGDAAALSFAGKTMRIDFAKGTILLNEQESAKFSPKSKVVEVSFLRGKPLVKADTDTVYPTAESSSETQSRDQEPVNKN